MRAIAFTGHFEHEPQKKRASQAIMQDLVFKKTMEFIEVPVFVNHPMEVSGF